MQRLHAISRLKFFYFCRIELFGYRPFPLLFKKKIRKFIVRLDQGHERIYQAHYVVMEMWYTWRLLKRFLKKNFNMDSEALCIHSMLRATLSFTRSHFLSLHSVGTRE